MFMTRLVISWLLAGLAVSVFAQEPPGASFSLTSAERHFGDILVYYTRQNIDMLGRCNSRSSSRQSSLDSFYQRYETSPQTLDDYSNAVTQAVARLRWLNQLLPAKQRVRVIIICGGRH